MKEKKRKEEKRVKKQVSIFRVHYLLLTRKDDQEEMEEKKRKEEKRLKKQAIIFFAHYLLLTRKDDREKKEVKKRVPIFCAH